VTWPTATNTRTPHLHGQGWERCQAASSAQPSRRPNYSLCGLKLRCHEASTVPKPPSPSPKSNRPGQTLLSPHHLTTQKPSVYSHESTLHYKIGQELTICLILKCPRRHVPGSASAARKLCRFRNEPNSPCLGAVRRTKRWKARV
jgi:hypothetical protein